MTQTPEVTIRQFEERDSPRVRELFIKINRSLSPPNMSEAFEAYIERSLVEEIDWISNYYGKRGGGFWVAVRDRQIVGMFGLESAGTGSFELRRMYVDPFARRRGVASTMLRFAEAECRRLGARKIELSTSELQSAAIALYERAGYEFVREAVAVDANNKTIGGGIRRYYFEKVL
jgi:GNAT superfamily N-acetyltransferase